MSDLTITASQVLPGADAEIDRLHNAGATITAGQSLYLDKTVTPNLWKPTDANAAATADVDGIALHGSLAGQPLAAQTSGEITLGAGAAMTVGETYGNSETAGGIAPISDRVTGVIVPNIGVAKTAAILKMARHNTQVVHA